MIKTPFNAWKPIDREKALEFAKWKVRAITMGKSDLERLEMVNRYFAKTRFTLADLGLK